MTTRRTPAKSAPGIRSPRCTKSCRQAKNVDVPEVDQLKYQETRNPLSRKRPQRGTADIEAALQIARGGYQHQA